MGLTDLFIKVDGCTATVRFSRFIPRFKKAQIALEQEIANSMERFIPRKSGALLNATREEQKSMLGSGKVVPVSTQLPYGRYQYHGTVMIDPATGKGPRAWRDNSGEMVYRYRKGAKLVPSARPLRYTNPNTVPEWFNAAKDADYPKWRETVRRVIWKGE